jgi:hypothetical protein
VRGEVWIFFVDVLAGRANDKARLLGRIETGSSVGKVGGGGFRQWGGGDLAGTARSRSGLETRSDNIAIGPGRNRLLMVFQYLKAIQTCKFISNAFPMSKNIET